MKSKTDRYIPEKPIVNTLIDTTLGCLDVKTYNGFNYDENIESLKLAIRRCESNDAMFRVLESLRTNLECGYDTVKELILSASFEIGAANPSLILMIDNLIGRDVLTLNYANITMAAELLCLSPKSRLFAWLYHNTILTVPIQRHEDSEIALKTSLIYIDLYLVDKEFQFAVEEAYKVNQLKCTVDKSLWKRLSVVFGTPFRAIHTQKTTSAFWLPVLSRAERCGNQKVCNLVHRIYNIAHTRTKQTKLHLRDNERVFGLWIHALWVLCNLGQVETSWYDSGGLRLIPNAVFISDVDRNVMLTSHLRREMLIGSHVDAVNMYTKRGKMEKKEWSHFINHSAIVKHEILEVRVDEINCMKQLMEKLHL